MNWPASFYHPGDPPQRRATDASPEPADRCAEELARQIRECAIDGADLASWNERACRLSACGDRAGLVDLVDEIAERWLLARAEIRRLRMELTEHRKQ